MDVLRFTLRGLIALLGLGFVACGAPESTTLDRGLRYLDDPLFRRAALEASIVDPTNDYSRQRLERYEQWSALDEWRPRVALMNDTRPATSFTPFDVDIERTENALFELGRRAFATYPVQIRPELTTGFEDPERYGLTPGDAVWVDVPDGAMPAVTCATCHRADGVDGAPNHDFELGRMVDDYFGAQTDNSTWAAGTLDVTSDGILNPTAITDLRPIADTDHLHRAATLVNDPIALAIRIETLLITSVSATQRPPRIVALGLAMYLWRMTESLPAWRTNPIYDATCAGCHGADGRPGPPRSIEEIGTDDAVARSPARGTGRWRVPSLRGVSTRKRFLSNGAVTSLKSLLDADRSTPGHRFGSALSDVDKDELLSWLSEL